MRKTTGNKEERRVNYKRKKDSKNKERLKSLRRNRKMEK